MPPRNKLVWSFNESRKRLQGSIADDPVIEWYPDGGGQLKLYYAIKKTITKYESFSLEPIKNYINLSLKEKLEKYYEK